MAELTDIEGHWAEAAIRWLVKRGRLSGYPNGTFRPDEPVTRAEYASSEHRQEMEATATWGITRALAACAYIEYDDADTDDDADGLGSGVWLGGWKLLTCAHMVAQRDGTPHEHLWVQGYPPAGFSPMRGHRQAAEVRGVYHDVDLAVLNVEPPFYEVECPTVPLAGSGPEYGQDLWAIGNPLGMRFDVADGQMRAPERVVNYWQEPQEVLSTTVSINPGNSGGLLIDESGELVGVPSAGVSPAHAENVGLAVPLGGIRYVLEQEGLL